ncbi:MAG: glycosyltransferase [Patescibacteria group bacterium]
MPNPKVSILLPVYNGARFIADAIKSVLAQTFRDWELIVLDDGSTDETEAVAKKAALADRRIRYKPNGTNLGIQKTLNRGLELACGEYVARIDDDDEWADPEKLAAQVSFLDVHGDYALVGTGAVVVDEDGRELFRYLFPERDAAIRKRILFKNCFIHSSVLFRRAAVMALGGYGEGETTRHVEDYDLWLRLGRTAKFANLPRYAVRFRLRPGNISSQNKAEQLRRGLVLAWRYGADYRNRFLAAVFGALRLFGYRIFLFLPMTVRQSILRRYKQF